MAADQNATTGPEAEAPTATAVGGASESHGGLND